MLFTRYMIIIMGILGGVNLNAVGQTSNHELAKLYLDNYISGNIAGLEPYLDENITFEDSADTFTGKDNVIKGLTRVFSDITINNYQEQDSYHSGAFYITHGVINFSIAAKAFGEAGRPYNFIIRFAVSLKMSDGKVLSHRDYVDSKDFMTQLKKQQTSRQQ